MDEKEIPDGVSADPKVVHEEWLRNLFPSDVHYMSLYLRRRSCGAPFLVWSGNPPSLDSVWSAEDAEGRSFGVGMAGIIALKISGVTTAPPPPGFPIEIDDADGRPWGRAVLYPSAATVFRVELFDAKGRSVGEFPPGETTEQGGE